MAIAMEPNKGSDRNTQGLGVQRGPDLKDSKGLPAEVMTEQVGKGCIGVSQVRNFKMHILERMVQVCPPVGNCRWFNMTRAIHDHEHVIDKNKVSNDLCFKNIGVLWDNLR